MITDICITVLFDENYIEPGLLTIYDLLNLKFIKKIPIYLIYLKNDDSNSETLTIIDKFINQNNFDNRLKGIIINNSVLDDFQIYHFNNSILYKCLLPSIIQHDFILNIDSGYLVGDYFEDFWMSTVKICPTLKNKDAVLAAYCNNSADDLPASLRSLPHNNLYPTGGVLLFNKLSYDDSDFYSRFISEFIKLKDRLVWAEQDLMCIVLANSEIVKLPLREHMLLEQLGLEGLKCKTRSQANSRPFSIYKITGSIKPWKKWATDGRRDYYLKKRFDFEKKFPLGHYALIKKNRYLKLNEAISIAYLDNFENNLISE